MITSHLERWRASRLALTQTQWFNKISIDERKPKKRQRQIKVYTNELEVGKTDISCRYGSRDNGATKNASSKPDVSETLCGIERVNSPIFQNLPIDSQSRQAKLWKMTSTGLIHFLIAHHASVNIGINGYGSIFEMAITRECSSSSSKRVSISNWMFQILTILFGHLR